MSSFAAIWSFFCFLVFMQKKFCMRGVLIPQSNHWLPMKSFEEFLSWCNLKSNVFNDFNITFQKILEFFFHSCSCFCCSIVSVSYFDFFVVSIIVEKFGDFLNFGSCHRYLAVLPFFLSNGRYHWLSNTSFSNLRSYRYQTAQYPQERNKLLSKTSAAYRLDITFHKKDQFLDFVNCFFCCSLA